MRYGVQGCPLSHGLCVAKSSMFFLLRDARHRRTSLSDLADELRRGDDDEDAGDFEVAVTKLDEAQSIIERHTDEKAGKELVQKKGLLCPQQSSLCFARSAYSYGVCVFRHL